jgi:hypothetical protein
MIDRFHRGQLPVMDSHGVRARLLCVVDGFVKTREEERALDPDADADADADPDPDAAPPPLSTVPHCPCFGAVPSGWQRFDSCDCSVGNMASTGGAASVRRAESDIERPVSAWP